MRLKFKEYRKTNDAVMVADIGFKKQLQTLDAELDIVWSGNKWEIWRFPGQKGNVKKIASERAVHVMTVQTQGRNFRELGADILLKLQAGDTRKFSTKELCDYFDKMDDNIERAKRKKVENWFESRRKEVAWYTRGLRLSVPRRFRGGHLLKGPSKEVKVRRALENG